MEGSDDEEDGDVEFADETFQTAASGTAIDADAMMMMMI